MPAKSHRVSVLAEHAGMRLDKWLSQLDFIPSRSRAAELIERGLITADGKSLKASFKVSAGSEILIELPEPESSEARLASPELPRLERSA